MLGVDSDQTEQSDLCRHRLSNRFLMTKQTTFDSCEPAIEITCGSALYDHYVRPSIRPLTVSHCECS